MQFQRHGSARSCVASALLVWVSVGLGCAAEEGSATTGPTPDPSGSGSGSSSEGRSESGSTSGADSQGTTEDPHSTDSTGPSPTEYLDRYPLQATFPEGGAFDTATEAFFVGTLEGGDVHRIDAQTGEQTLFYSDERPGSWMTLGMAVDADRDRLWVCAANRDTEPFTGEVWQFDLGSGTRQHAVELSFEGELAWCEDVAVAPDGTAYLTDRENPNVYRVGPSFAQELFATDDALGSALIGQNGIVVVPGQDFLLTAVHLPATLQRISLRDGTVLPIDLEGDFVDNAIGSGADGMAYVDGDLFVVFDGKLARVTPQAADWSSAVSTTVELPRGLTDVLHTPQGLYLLNGQAIGFALGNPAEPFELVRFAGDL